jgi:PIN domain nuclease of toxin-antitoxin system
MPGVEAFAASPLVALRQLGALELPVTARHAETAARLDAFHGDPIDRMLIAQSLVEGIPLVTRDVVIRAFPVATIW